MPSKRDVEAGRAFVRLYLKNDFGRQLNRALTAAGHKLKSFGRGTMMAGAGVAAAGTAILTPLTLAVKSFADAGDMLDKMARRTGIAGSALAELSFAAEQSGTNLDDFEQSLRRMQRSIEDAKRGLSTAVDGLEMVGLTVKDIEGLSPDEQFQRIADGVAALQDPTKKAAATMMLFGRSGTMMLPMLDGLRGLRKEARDLGIIPTQQEIDNAAKVTDAINRVRRVVKKFIFDVGSRMAEPVLRLLDHAKTAAITVGDFAKRNAHWIMMLAGVGSALVAAGAVVTTFGFTIMGVGAAVSALGTVLGAILSPLGLVVAGIAGATVAFVKWTDAGQAAYQSLHGLFGNLLSWAQEVFGGIREAMAAGDMQLAADIMWAGIRVAWTKGIGWVRQQWAELRYFLVEKWGEASFAILDTVNYLTSGMTEAFWAAADKIVDSWKFVEKSFAKGIGWVMAKMQGLDPNEMMTILEEDYGREQAGRDARRAARDTANKDAADARYNANDEARKEWMRGAAANRDATVSDAEKQLEDARAKLTEALKKTPAMTPDKGGGVGAASTVTTRDGGVTKAPGGGVSLAATYSASAARISGFQTSGPEQKMAAGIETIAKNTSDFTRLQEEFLAGMRVA